MNLCLFKGLFGGHTVFSGMAYFWEAYYLEKCCSISKWVGTEKKTALNYGKNAAQINLKQPTLAVLGLVLSRMAYYKFIK